MQPPWCLLRRLLLGTSRDCHAPSFTFVSTLGVCVGGAEGSLVDYTPSISNIKLRLSSPQKLGFQSIKPAFKYNYYHWKRKQTLSSFQIILNHLLLLRATIPQLLSRCLLLTLLASATAHQAEDPLQTTTPAAHHMETSLSRKATLQLSSITGTRPATPATPEQHTLAAIQSHHSASLVGQFPSCYRISPQGNRLLSIGRLDIQAMDLQLPPELAALGLTSIGMYTTALEGSLGQVLLQV